MKEKTKEVLIADIIKQVAEEYKCEQWSNSDLQGYCLAKAKEIINKGRLNYKNKIIK